jgi:histidinol-phosphate aminotransferase
MYPEYARDTFTSWKLAHRNEDFTLNVERTIEAINEYGPSMVLVTSPNNPTGTILPQKDIEALLEACEHAAVSGAPAGAHPILVVDEAYVEFRDPGTPSAVELLSEHRNLAVSRTMSKAFAFAGARVGYLAADEGIIDAVRIVRMPYHLSAVTQAAALAAFEHTDEQLSCVERLRQTREQTASWIAGQSYKGTALTVAPSGSNFVLFGTFDDRESIFRELLDRGVLIRVVGPQGWLRVCMGTDEEMARFRQAFSEVLSLHNAQ